MNQNSEWRSVRIGLFIALALVVAALAIIGISSRRKLFEKKVVYYSFFPNAGGLRAGNGVWYQGVAVGFITSVNFAKNPDVEKVCVTYKVSRRLAPRIRIGTRASVKTLGLLGDKYLALITPPHSESQPNILPGHEIPIDKSLNLAALSRGAQGLLESTTNLSKNINKLVDIINNGKGALPRLLNDPKLGKTLATQLTSIGQSLQTITSSLASDGGLGGRLITDKAYGDKVAKELADSVRLTDLILEDFHEGTGRKIMENISETSKSLAKVAASFEQKNTLGYKLFLDDQYSGQLAKNLLSISTSLSSILKKIDSGQGTIGALINDRSVYNSLSVATEGIRKSHIIMWYLKHKAEKAAREAKRRYEKGKTQ